MSETASPPVAGVERLKAAARKRDAGCQHEARHKWKSQRGDEAEYLQSAREHATLEVRLTDLQEALRALASPVSGDGSSADADTHRAAEGAVVVPKDWLQGVWNMGNDALNRLPKDPQGALVSLTGAMMALHAVMPPPPAASVSPGMETLQASECTKHGEGEQ